jgi:hypothetical protein
VTSAAGRFRLAALLAAGVLAVHELRYALAYGATAGRHAAEQGHAYLSVVVPLVMLGALVAAAQLLLRFAGGRPSTGRAVRVARLWLGCALTLAAAYCAQETIEGWLAAGHPAGVAGVLAHGGWIGLACAPVVGGLIALAVRGAVAAVEPRTAAAAWRPALRPMPAIAPPAPVFGLSPDPVARFLAGRGPPLTSV